MMGQIPALTKPNNALYRVPLNAGLEARKADLEARKADLEARKAKARKENEELAATLQQLQDKRIKITNYQNDQLAESKINLEKIKAENAKRRILLDEHNVNIEKMGTRIAEMKAKKKGNEDYEELKEIISKIGHYGDDPIPDVSEEELPKLRERMQELEQKLLSAENAQGDETKSLGSLGGKSRKYKKNSKRNTRKGKNRKTPRKQGFNRSKKRKN
jgi:hypothetical protein